MTRTCPAFVAVRWDSLSNEPVAKIQKLEQTFFSLILAIFFVPWVT